MWLEEVGCDGSESDIGECVDEWGNVSSNCQEHTRDAGVICAGRIIMTVTKIKYRII